MDQTGNTQQPSQKPYMRGDLTNDKTKLQMFVESDKNYLEFRKIFDGFSDKDSRIEKFKEVSEDWSNAEFFSTDVNDTEEVEFARGLADQALNSMDIEEVKIVLAMLL